MPTVTNTIKRPDGTPFEGAQVRVRLIASASGQDAPGFVSGSDYTILGEWGFVTGATGVWSATLVANPLINPSGTAYLVTETAASRPAASYYILVPNGAGPYFVEDILTTQPASVADSALTALTASLDALKVVVPQRGSIEHDLLEFSDTVNNSLATFTIPGGQAVGGHEYRMRVWGEIRNSTGADVTLTFRLYRNGVSIRNYGAIVVPDGGSNFRQWGATLTQFMDNDYSLNIVTERLWIGPTSSGGVLQGDNIAERSTWNQQNLVAGDWATDTTFEIRGQFSVAATLRRHGHDLTTTKTTPG